MDENQLVNSDMPMSNLRTNLWPSDGTSPPFGSLIELAYKLKEVELRLLRKFGDISESYVECNHLSVTDELNTANNVNSRPPSDRLLYRENRYDYFFAKSSQNVANPLSNLSSSSLCLSLERVQPSYELPQLDKIQVKRIPQNNVNSIQASFKPEIHSKKRSSGKSFSLSKRQVHSTVCRGPHSTELQKTRKSRRVRAFQTDSKRKHNCPLCSYQTDNRCHLRRHQSSVHNADKAYYCFICRKEFSRSERVKAHFLSIHPEISYHPKIVRKELYMTEDLKVKDFEIAAKDVSEVSLPQKTETNETHPRDEVDPTSDDSGNNQKSWEKYCRIARPPFNTQKIFCCRTCNFSGSDIWQMKKHHLDVHLGATTFVCRICRYSSSCMTRIVSHMLGHGELICFYCSYSTTEVKLFERHVKDCSAPLHCFVCDSCFPDRDQLLSHAEQSHGLMTISCCKRCSFNTSSHEELQKHEVLHTVSNPLLVQEVESDDEMLLGPYRSRSEALSASFPPVLSKRLEETGGNDLQTSFELNPRLETESTENTRTVVTSEAGNSSTTDFISRSSSTSVCPSSLINRCPMPACGFKAAWKKSLELHTENYHNIYFDRCKEERQSPTRPNERGSAGLPRMAAAVCPLSGFFPCPFCPNYRTFKYRRSFEKHLAQHGLDHKKYPYFVAGLNLKIADNAISVRAVD